MGLKRKWSIWHTLANLVACMSTKRELLGIQLKLECLMGGKGRVSGCNVGERMNVEKWVGRTLSSQADLFHLVCEIGVVWV